MSNWNRFLDRLLAAQLGVEEHRLALALARNLLGFRKPADHLGKGLLREASRLHGWSFDRARDGLVAKGLVRYTPPGTTGRGHRGHYELLLHDDDESAAPARQFEQESAARSAAESAAESAAPERQRIEQRAESKEQASVHRPDAAKATPAVDPETVIGDEDEEALADLVEELVDADSNTLSCYRRHFLGKLDASDFDHAANVLAKRRIGTRLGSGPLETEAGFVFGVLSARAYCKNWEPPE